MILSILPVSLNFCDSLRWLKKTLLFEKVSLLILYIFLIPNSLNWKLINLLKLNKSLSLFLYLKKIAYFLFLLINLLLKSFDTSKFLKLKQGPIRTTIFFLIIFCLTKYSIPLAAIFFNAPFQPEWRAQIYFLFLSKIKIGQQSAVKTPKAICLLLVINPSPEYLLPIFFLLEMVEYQKKKTFHWTVA